MKNNKRLIYLAVFLILITTIVSSYLYFQRKQEFPVSTGGDVMQVVPVGYYEESKAMEALAKELPLSTPDFLLTFNYKKGMYVITPKEGVDGAKAFLLWYKFSPYRAIPESRFSIE